MLLVKKNRIADNKPNYLHLGSELGSFDRALVKIGHHTIVVRAEYCICQHNYRSTFQFLGNFFAKCHQFVKTSELKLRRILVGSKKDKSFRE